jgi:hypothetical protein
MSLDSQSDERVSTYSAAEHAARAKSLELLYDYTKFHLGVYLTVTALYIAVVKAKISSVEGILPANQFLVFIAVVAFLLAGLAGGVIASSITQRIGGSSLEFLDTQIGPWHAERIHMSGRQWTQTEHTAFWIGLIAAVLSFFVPKF